MTPIHQIAAGDLPARTRVGVEFRTQRPAGAAIRATTAILLAATCGAVLCGGPALSQTFEDLTVTVAEDGSCYVVHIENRLTGAVLTGTYTVDAPILISLDVVRGSGDVPEQIRITTDDSYFADPADLVLPDKASADVLVCQRVGA